jgi:predicted O-linked N-acetylglucosamine transferase (SPINDLY family)
MSMWDFFRRRDSQALTPDPEKLAIELIDQGNQAEEAGQLDNAMQRYEAALRIAPELPRAHLNLGNLLGRQGRHDAALASYREVLRLAPGHAGAHFNIGNVHTDEGRFGEALAAYQQAVSLDPTMVDAHVAAGYVLDETGHADAAVESYERALALRPDYAEVHSNLGVAHRKAGRFQQALQCYLRALELDATRADTHMNLGNLLRDLGRLEEAEASYRHALELQPDHLDAFSGLLGLHNYRTTLSPAELLAEARLFGEIAARSARPYRQWKGSTDEDRCLRIGLVSGDLRQHPVGYFLENVLSSLARQAQGRLSLHAYPSFRCDDATAQRLRSHSASWTLIEGRRDQEVAAKIHDDAIDILIDLSGHTAHSRLPMFCWRPSPVAVSWLGYFATTGVAEIDYLIADPLTLPAALEENFTEKIWRLPQTRLCFTPPMVDVDVSPLPSAGGSPFTFGCFNNLTKVTDEVLALWSRVLGAVPDSRLFLKAAQLSDAEELRRIEQRLVAAGVASHRLMLEGLSARADYLASYGRVDIGLDPFPFTGGTTTAEALWMGVPVLTLTGNSFLSRQGVGLLTNAGLSDWVARDADDYVRIAAAKAADLGSLATLRGRLRAQVLDSPLFDSGQFAGHLEAVLREMWRTHCRLGSR